MARSSNMNPVEEVVVFFACGPSREEIAAFHLSEAAQEHIRALLDKNRTGALTREETRELDKIMVLNEVISLIRVRAQVSNEHPTASSTVMGA